MMTPGTPLDFDGIVKDLKGQLADGTGMGIAMYRKQTRVLLDGIKALQTRLPEGRRYIDDDFLAKINDSRYSSEWVGIALRWQLNAAPQGKDQKATGTPEQSPMTEPAGAAPLCSHNWLYVVNAAGNAPYWQCDKCLDSTSVDPKTSRSPPLHKEKP